jgi:hypothetical protein
LKHLDNFDLQQVNEKHLNLGSQQEGLEKLGFLQEQVDFLQLGDLQYLNLHIFGHLEHLHNLWNLEESFLLQAKLPNRPNPNAPIMIKQLYPPSLGMTSRIEDTV